LLALETGPAFRFDLDHLVPTETAQRKRKLSRKGLLLIKSFEGFRPRAVLRRDGALTIGYGHTLSARRDVEITEPEAELLLLHDLIPIVNYIHTDIRRPLNQNQFDALVSFIYNIGLERIRQSDVPALVRKGQMASAAEALSTEPDRKPPATDLPYRRRCAERALFETPASHSPSLADILTAPVSRPGILSFPSMETPLGETGVVRHEDPVLSGISTPQTRNETCFGWRDIGSTALMILIGLMVGIAAVAALKQALEVTNVQMHAATIGAVLCVVGTSLIGFAIWAFKNTRSKVRKPAN